MHTPANDLEDLLVNRQSFNLRKQQREWDGKIFKSHQTVHATWQIWEDLAVAQNDGVFLEANEDGEFPAVFARGDDEARVVLEPEAASEVVEVQYGRDKGAAGAGLDVDVAGGDGVDRGFVDSDLHFKRELKEQAEIGKGLWYPVERRLGP